MEERDLLALLAALLALLTKEKGVCVEERDLLALLAALLALLTKEEGVCVEERDRGRAPFRHVLSTAGRAISVQWCHLQVKQVSSK